MKWYKHETSANMDAKLQEILLDYGLEGYGLYWYCLELVAFNVTPEKLTFELEHDARIIARNTSVSVRKVQEMMEKFIELGLFENSDGRITCLKLAKQADDYTAKYLKTQLTELQQLSNGVGQNPTKSDKVRQSPPKGKESKLKKTKKISDVDTSPVDKPSLPTCPQKEIVKLYHDKLPELRQVRAWNGQRAKMLRCRWAEDTERQDLGFWEDFFGFVGRCDFLMGRSEGRNGSPPFQADLEWLIRPSNFIKVVEGKYENR